MSKELEIKFGDELLTKGRTPNRFVVLDTCGHKGEVVVAPVMEIGGVEALGLAGTLHADRSTEISKTWEINRIVAALNAFLRDNSIVELLPDNFKKPPVKINIMK